jgi:hypothetical protein
VWGLVIGLVVGIGGVMVIGRTQAPEYWLIFGGNTDPGDGQGGGLARDQMIAGGWTSADASYQIQWAADIGQGTARVTDESMARAHAVYEERCRNRRCVIAGFSLGTAPANQLSQEVGHAPDATYEFGGPYSATGLFHSKAADHPFVEPWVTAFGGINTDRNVSPGTHALFDTRDPYGNAAPQCYGPGIYALTLDGHRIISRAEASVHVWTGPDGVVNHEAGPPPNGLPASGDGPSAPWAGCPGGNWYSDNETPAAPGPVPGVPGVPDPNATPEAPIPGAPGLPSEVPGAPALPGLPAPPGG